MKGKTQTKRKIKRNAEDWIMDSVIFVVMILVLVVTIYPFWNVIIQAFNAAGDTARGGLWLFPRQFTLQNFKELLSDSGWGNAIFVSVARTVVGTVLGVSVTGIVAFAMSQTDLLFRNMYYRIFMFTMYFGGGIIPFYILLKTIHMNNTIWVYVIPGCLSVYNMLIMINFYQSIPKSLYESAQLDGATYMQIFVKITVPLSKACVATIALYNAVGQWNAWMDTAYYTSSENLKTMSMKMMEIINLSAITVEKGDTMTAGAVASALQATPRSLQCASMVLAVTPILCVYPFLQKYFVKGVMIGSVKE